MIKNLKRRLCCLLLCGVFVFLGARLEIPAFGAGQEAVLAENDLTGDIDSENVTEEYRLTGKETRQSVTDAVYEKEIKERANPDYTQVDDLKLVNAVVVKQSLYDGANVKDGDTIDSIMSGIEEGKETEAAKFFTQISNVVALYELSEESDYYVAFVNTMDSDKNAEVQDYVFALNDNDGNILKGCIYEYETGLAYIPKSDCLNEDGEQIILNIQVQLMQVIASADVSSEIIMSVKEDRSSVEVYKSEEKIFDVEATVETETGLEEENMTVAVNGIPIQDEYYAYDAETGELTLNQSAAMIQSISVSTEKDSVFEQISSLLFPSTRAYAMTADQMTAVAENIELPEWVTTGTLMTGSANYSYDPVGGWTYSYGFGTNSEILLKEMINLIEYGGALDMSKISSQEGSKYMTVFTDLAVNTLSNNSRTIPGLQNIPKLHMECCHVDTVLGSVSGSAVMGSKWSLQPIRLRFLNVDRAQGYAIIGIYTIETHTQTGCAFFKIGLKPSYGYGNIAKKDAQSGEVLAGGVYRVYTDSACTAGATDMNGNAAVFTTTASEPYSNTICFSPGTYYVKEIQPPEGYMTDTGVKILNIRSGERTWATASGADFDWNYDNRKIFLNLRKISADENLTSGNSCYTLSGACYGVYHSESDAISDANRAATLQTDASGNSNTVRLDTGTYYIRELVASPGYSICRGTKDQANAAGIHVIEASGYGQTYTVTCAEPVLTSSYILQMRKWDIDTKEQTAQGQATLAEAVFRVEYFDNTDGNCSGAAKKVWLYKTDHTGVIFGNDTSKLVDALTINGQDFSGSKDIFTSSENGQAVLPLGTYRISEIQAPAYYQLNGVIKFDGETGEGTELGLGKTIVVREENDTAVVRDGGGSSQSVLEEEQSPVNMYDTIYRGSITFTKKDADGQPMAEVVFRIKGESTGEEYEGVTDENGEVVWTELLPQTYRITEVKTADGKSLLKDDITIQLPLEMEEKELDDTLDLTKAVWDPALSKYCFYDLSYEVTNHAKLTLPMTGGFSGRRMALCVIGTAFVAIAFLAIMRQRRNSAVKTTHK